MELPRQRRRTSRTTSAETVQPAWGRFGPQRDAVPPGKTRHDSGEPWTAEARSAIRGVPSMIAPEECNILIRPYHADGKWIRSRKLRKRAYDFRRFRLLFT
ncbi:hypothetical protein SAMN04488595_102250 [Ralstonia sp. 25mfcol4.1]|nr:hypothetical protein SAMN04488595_102250 [Ralstonia sp. 25mfcol4.1]